MDKKREEGFHYLVAELKEFCVISFHGEMDKKSSKALEECTEHIKSCKSIYFVINFLEVTHIDKNAYRNLVQLQATIRSEKEHNLRISDINPISKNQLLEKGIIRADEISDNLKGALMSLKFLAIK